MSWVRLIVLGFVVAHGIGHSIWFIGAWVPQTRLVASGGWLLPGGVSIGDPIGKLFGLLALAAMLAFFAAAWGLFQHQEWWRAMLVVAVVVSLVSVVPWWTLSPGTTAINATVADVAALIFLLLPASNEILSV